MDQARWRRLFSFTQFVNFSIISAMSQLNSNAQEFTPGQQFVYAHPAWNEAQSWNQYQYGNEKPSEWPVHTTPNGALYHEAVPVNGAYATQRAVSDDASFAAFWNLCPSCTEDELRGALDEIDFKPAIVQAQSA